MTTATQQTLIVSITATAPTAEVLEVLEERPKSYLVRNSDTGCTAWLPKSGLRACKPGEATYENVFTLAYWFRSRLDRRQERVLGILE